MTLGCVEWTVKAKQENSLEKVTRFKQPCCPSMAEAWVQSLAQEENGPDLISFIYEATRSQGLGHRLELPTSV